MQSRRAFTAHVVLGTVGTAAVPCVARAGGIGVRPSRIRNTAEVTLDRMAAWVAGRFQASGTKASAELELLRVLPLRWHVGRVGEKFSLVFRGPVDRPLPQDLYRFEHAEAGTFELLLVPVVTRHAAELRYEAIINREPVPAGIVRA